MRFLRTTHILSLTSTAWRHRSPLDQNIHSSDAGSHITDLREFLDQSLTDPAYTSHMNTEAQQNMLADWQKLLSPSLTDPHQGHSSIDGLSPDHNIRVNDPKSQGYSGHFLDFPHIQEKTFSNYFDTAIATHLRGIQKHAPSGSYLQERLPDLEPLDSDPAHDSGNRARVYNKGWLNHEKDLPSDSDMKLVFTKRPKMSEEREYIERKIGENDLVIMNEVASNLLKTCTDALKKTQQPDSMPHLFHMNLLLDGSKLRDFKLRLTTEVEENAENRFWISPFRPNNSVYSEEIILGKMRQLIQEMWSLQTRYSSFGV
ncbi:hypothetical protein PSHT_09780 [Puccinia striiformis]|uniref:Uncharacterized protein n=1 Tax=Puccinia striiformis TaxID=27350 RepID=A0A2S4VEL7_9BASI|nr:hypothetical protein PSHT_09780 [Puccinia striiformis]